MKRTVVTVIACSLLLIGVTLLIRLRPGRMPADRLAWPTSKTKMGRCESRPKNAPISEPNRFQRPAPSQAVATNPKPRPPKDPRKNWLTEFELTERSGKLISSQSFLASLTCRFLLCDLPSICVRQNEKFKILQDKFRGQPIRLVEITCDPEVDRPEVLAEYANRFQADPQQWLFFTGEMDYISRVGSEMYQIGIVRRGHPEKFALVDAAGKIYGYYTWSDPGQWQAFNVI